jgi:large subunit ribosomal protein L35
MPKLKSRKAAVKRFKVTKSGKIMRYHAGKKHILEHRLPGSKRTKRGMVEIAPSDRKQVKRMLHI